MAYEAMFSRSFTRYDQKKMGYGALVAGFIVVLTFCTVFKPYLGPWPVLNFKLSMGIGHKMFMTLEEDRSKKTPDVENENVTVKAEVSVQLVEYKAENATQIVEEVMQHHTQAESIADQPEMLAPTNQSALEENAKISRPPLCNVAWSMSDFCELPSAVRIHPNLSTVYVPSTLGGNNNSWRIRPYALKDDPVAMRLVREWSVTGSSGGGGEVSQCTRNHSIPAVMFSIGGFSGNHFHDFSDIILPLYLTSRRFDGEVQFIVTDYRHWWTVKFRKVLEKLSKYAVIDIDNEQDVHCYPNAIIGLMRQDYQQLSLDPSKPPNYTTSDFREFLRDAYSLNRSAVAKLRDGDGTSRPRLLVLSRKRSRAFTNIGRILHLAKRTGFDPVVAEADMDVSRFAEIMNSCDAAMGVHGAGLTNVLFLPDNGVLIQVVPYGGVEWVSRTYFGDPSRAMGLNYLEYGISLKESTLSEQFRGDDMVIRDPVGFHKHHWDVFRSVYLDKQNVKLDVSRFKPTLQRAFHLLQ